MNTISRFTFPRKDYPMEAFKRAIYDLSSLGYFYLTSNDTEFTISLEGESSLPQEELRKVVFEAVLDHDLRLQLEEKFGAIRNVIVEQAIAPVANNTLSKKITSRTS